MQSEKRVLQIYDWAKMEKVLAQLPLFRRIVLPLLLGKLLEPRVILYIWVGKLWMTWANCADLLCKAPKLKLIPFKKSCI